MTSTTDSTIDMSSSSSMMTDMNTLEFYSKDLVSLLKQSLLASPGATAGTTSNNSSVVASQNGATNRDEVVGIRGCRANFSDSDDSDDDDDDNNDNNDNDNNDDSNDDDIIIEENEDPNTDLDTKSSNKDDTTTATVANGATSATLKGVTNDTVVRFKETTKNTDTATNNNNTNNNTNGGGKRNKSNKKKNRKKKTKEDLMKQMIPPPTSLLILTTTENENDDEPNNTKNTSETTEPMNYATALRIPTALLPRSQPNTDNDNPYAPSSSPPPVLQSLYQLSNALSTPPTNNTKPNTLILLLQSGRLALAIFHQHTCLRHTTSTQYTTRRGQGGAQSSNDTSGGKAQSIGSQLRRAGEGKLREDLVRVLSGWREEEEKGNGGVCLLGGCGYFFIAVSKTLVGGFWEDVETALGSGTHTKQSSKGGGEEGIGLCKGGDRVRNIPMDFGRPSFDACRAVYDHMMRCTIVRINLDFVSPSSPEEIEAVSVTEQQEEDSSKAVATSNRIEFDDIPLTPLHEAARDGNHEQLLHLLTTTITADGSTSVDDVNTRAGPKLMTPLHYAAASSSPTTTTTTTNHTHNPSKCITTLLVNHHANPSLLDAHGRPAYYLSTNEAMRIAFRTARATLGENTPYDWDEGGARVGPPLTLDDITRRNTKAKEKKRRQRQSKKQRNVTKREEDALETKTKEEEEEKVRKEEEARRVRAGLAAKKKIGGVKEGTECDFCQKMCVGKRRVQMFTRLAFVYCTVECVNRHKRELMAAAATARFSGGGGST